MNTPAETRDKAVNLKDDFHIFMENHWHSFAQKGQTKWAVSVWKKNTSQKYKEGVLGNISLKMQFFVLIDDIIQGLIDLSSSIS